MSNFAPKKIELDQRRVVSQDVLETIDKMKGLDSHFQFKMMMELYDKHLVLNTEPVIVKYRDIVKIISDAKSAMSDLPGNLKVTKENISNDDIRFIAILEALISNLNRMEAFKKLPRIDYTK